MKFSTTDLVLQTVSNDDIHKVARMWNFEKGPIPLQEAQKAIDDMQENHKKNKTGYIYHICFAIYKIDGNEIIGWCNLDGKTKGKLYIFYSIDSHYRNKGYATQCAEKLLSYAFNEAKVSFVNGGCDKNNKSSFRVMEKIGMQQNAFEDNGDPLFYIDAQTYSSGKYH